MFKYESIYCEAVADIMMTFVAASNEGRLADETFSVAVDSYVFVSVSYLSLLQNQNKYPHEIDEVVILCDILSSGLDYIKEVFSGLDSLVSLPCEKPN